jgi:CubicO group peptidase (beta-lactamase class C family)
VNSKSRFFSKKNQPALSPLIILLCITSLTFSCAKNKVVDRMENYLNASHRVWNFHGSVVVARKGEVLLKKGVGMANAEKETRITPSTKFMIGSITKTFTAAAVMQLEERGLLSLNDPVTKHIPDYPDEAGEKITIHHLLSHTSGIPDIAANALHLGDTTKSRAPRDLIRLFQDEPLEFEPGENSRYSSSGYVLLGLIIEKVSGQTYYDYVRDHIFSSLNMNASGYCEDYHNHPGFAAGYIEASDGSLVSAPYIHPSLGYAAGGLYSTVEDMLKWDQALYSTKILSRSSLEKMLDPVKQTYGYGWMVMETWGRKDICHGGGTPGFNAWIERWVDDEVFTAVFSNNAWAPAGEIGRTLAAILFNQKYEIPRPRSIIKLDPSVCGDYPGVYRIDQNTYLLLVLINSRRHLERRFSLLTGLYSEA